MFIQSIDPCIPDRIEPKEEVGIVKSGQRAEDLDQVLLADLSRSASRLDKTC